MRSPVDLLDIYKYSCTNLRKQMYKKIIKNVLALIWISVVIYFYFTQTVSGTNSIIHSYYTESLTVSLKYLFFILIIPILYACYCLYIWFNKNKKTISIKISAPRILITFFLLLILAGNTVFLIKTPSFYHGDSLFITSDGTLKEVADISTISGDETLIVASESAYEWTDYAITDDVDPVLKNRFEKATFWGIQFGLVSKSLGIISMLFLITLIATGLGHTILKTIKKDHVLDFDNAIIGFGTGLFSIILISFIIGALHVLTIYSAWALLIAMGTISYKSVLEILKKLFKTSFSVETSMANINIFIIFVLGMVLTMNFIDNISPTARGWDGMNQYVNIAKRIEETNGLIQMGGNYYWELLMGFGLIATKWITIALNLASFYPALLSAIVLYWILSKFSSKSTALLVTAWFYTMPMMLFHGTEENKVDLGNTLIAMIGFLSLYKGLSSNDRKEQLTLLGIAGLMSGLCLGIKITSLILIFTFITIILYKYFKKTGAVAGFLFSLSALLIAEKAIIINELPIPQEIFGTVGSILMLVSIILIIWKTFKQHSFKPLISLLIFTAFAITAFMPWMIKNYSEGGSFSQAELLFGINPQPIIDYESLTGELAIDEASCAETGTEEELDRYIGYDSNTLKKYLTFPWHLTMNDIGVRGLYVDFGWLPLALLIGLLPFINRKNIDEKLIIAFLFFTTYWFLWLITSNGIIWYGLPGFLAISILAAQLIENYKTEEHTLQKYLIPALIIILIIPALSFRLYNFGKGSLLLYTANVMTADEATTGIFPYGLQVHDLFEADQDGQYDLIWKIGTSLNYFIEDNFWRTYNDQYMDVMNCLYTERDPDLLTKRLKALGFGYIIFDYYSNTLSIDPNGTLNDKYQAIIDYVLNYTEIVIPDYFRGHLVGKIIGT